MSSDTFNGLMNEAIKRSGMSDAGFANSRTRISVIPGHAFR